MDTKNVNDAPYKHRNEKIFRTTKMPLFSQLNIKQ